MATVGMMSSNMAHSNDVSKSMDLPPSPSNSVPFIIATAADEEKPEKAVAPVNDGSPMRYLQASSKLDLEPNPFEQSFSGMSGKGSDAVKVETPKPVLPPIASMSGRLAPNSEQYGWDAQSLRMGPLSPSMLEGPQNPIVFDKPSSQNPVPVGSFPTSSASLSTVFSSAPIAQVPFAGLPGPLPVPPAVQETYPMAPPSYNQQHATHQSNQGTQPQFTNSHPPMNNRYMGPHPENDQGNLHLLSQAQAAVRESWTKRESTDQNSLPGMPGMVAAPQMPKNGVEPAFIRGVRRSRVASEDNSDDSEESRQSGEGSNKKKNTGAVDDKMDEEEKRKNFLERNRQAALKCRQRKKQWLSNLQAKVEYLSTDNEHLQNQTAMLRDEIIHLKALLLAHKDCPVAQANGVYADAIGVPNHGSMPPHGRHPMPQQQQGRGPPRGHPPPPQPHHHHSPSMQHGPLQGSGMNGNNNNSGPRMAHPTSSAPAGSMVTVAGANRPMSMMQDITPNASPSHNQPPGRY
ncbi:hypothetical protein BG006_008224 [Podila minutissima]|uniref:BZIP domain-containing protein n=1 Tax=Podila minutissima TaxID=64525 RepID=A0A9P5SGQ8_9FUNG|nr:hypothetical protein BG006_008224 [Podila minutissima]